MSALVLIPVPDALNHSVQGAVAEYLKAKSKHGDKVIDGPGYGDPERLAILMEEVGEVAHELTYDAAQSVVQKPNGLGGTITLTADERLYRELLQVAAMALAWAGEVARRG